MSKVAAVVLCLSLAAVVHAQIALTIRDYAGVDRRATPVRGGVPFGLKELADCDRARLVTEDGAELPCSVRPLARWYDGSIKWLLVDTQVDVPAHGELRLSLLPGENPATGPKLKLTEQADSIAVDTGPARFVFSRRQFGLPAAAWADLNGDGVAETQVIGAGSEFTCEVEHEPPGPPQEENWLRDAAGGQRERFTAAPEGDYLAQVESANDLHAVIKLSGWLVNPEGRRLLQYFIRAHAWAGRPDLGLVVTFVYAGNPKQDFIRTLSLRLPWQTRATTWALGAGQRQEGELAPGDSVSLYEIGPEKTYHLAPYDQDKTVYCSVVRNGQEIASGQEAQGWARLADARGALTVAVRNFWQMHPKQLQLDPGGVTVYLWPELGGKVLDLRRRSDEIDNVYHYDLSLWPYGGEGVGVTHQMLLHLGPAGEDNAAELSAGLDAPLWLQCEPDQYARTLAFGPIAPADPENYPHLEGLLNVIVEWIRHNQRTFHWDGMIDFGDTFFHGYATRSHYGYISEKGWCSRGYVGWLNNDGTLTHSLFLAALRTGDYDTFLTAEAMCRHVMDVDTCHYCAAEPGHVGGGHRHDQQHWGNGVRGYGTATHGVMDLYCLTGDERALDVAREYALYHDTGIPAENEDRVGGLIRLWEITGEEHLKRRADELLAEELAVAPDRPWRFRTEPHFRFVSNTSASIVAYLYSAPPQDAFALIDAVVRSADGKRNATMVLWEDPGGYPILTLTALAYLNTGDQGYADMLAGLLQRQKASLRVQYQVPPGYLQLLRSLDFLGMLEEARAWSVNNIYIANIERLAPYPYVIAALRQAGMDEAAIWAVPLSNDPPPPFEEILDPAKITKAYGDTYQGKPSYAYNYALDHGSPSDRGSRSQLMLLEDGKPLIPHSAHVDIIFQGMGRFSHWGARGLVFSTSDNTDPRTNGRTYKVVFPWEG